MWVSEMYSVQFRFQQMLNAVSTQEGTLVEDVAYIQAWTPATSNAYYTLSYTTRLLTLYDVRLIVTLFTVHLWFIHFAIWTC